MEKKELTFPREWEYRVFCQVGGFDALVQKITGLVKESDPAVQCSAGDISKSGSYRAIRVRMMVDSLAQAEELGEQIKALPGVKFIF